MEYRIQRASMKEVVAIGIVSAIAFVGIALSLVGVAHAAIGFGSVQVTESVVGGTANPSDFTVTIKGGANVGNLTGSGNVIIFSDLIPGTYTVSQTAGPSGYTVTWGGDCNAQGVVTVTSNGTASCTATNTFGAVGSIKVLQVVSGGTAHTSDFTVHIVKSGAVDTGSPSGTGDSVTFGNLIPGSYTIKEAGVPAGYTTTWSGNCNAQGSITVTANTTSTCTITNTFVPTGGGGSGGGDRGGTGRTPRTVPVRTPR